MDIKKLFFNTEDFILDSKKIGEGTFGTVYLATNIKNKKKYAVKILKTEQSFNGNSQMQFMQESMILQQLQNPGIVQFKGINFQSFTNSSKLESIHHHGISTQRLIKKHS